MNCNTASLDPYIPSAVNPWDFQKITHLYRRAAFGITTLKANEVLAKSPDAAVDELIAEAIALTESTPEWLYEDSATTITGLNEEELRTFIREDAIRHTLNSSLKYRLAQFWCDHFVIQADGEAPIFPQFVGQYYYDFILKHCLGNFKTMYTEIGLQPAMLHYLDAFENIKGAVNENYAREMLELFSLGEGNAYTQQDIEEISRALTGYNTYDTEAVKVVFNADNFDDTDKTIFGETGNWGYDDVIRILFEKHSDKIAYFICEKLYNYLVSPISTEVIINELAATFLANDFEIVPVISQLLKSEHFFDTNTQGVIIKSPMDFRCGISNEIKGFLSEEQLQITDIQFIDGEIASIGQWMLNPPDVSGWPGDISWINTDTFSTRNTLSTNYLNQTYGVDPEPYLTFVQNLMVENTTDANLVCRTIIDFVLPIALNNEMEYEEALVFFKGEVPEIYFEDGTWHLEYDDEVVANQVKNLLSYIFSIPDFQLK